MNERITLLVLHTCVLMADLVEVADISSNSAKSVTIEMCREHTYLSKTNCEPCSKCGQFEYIKSRCNSTHDAVCECMPGFYRDISDGQCKVCTKCPVGWGASPACTSVSNTVCVVCPKDSYSSIESSTKSCQSCTLCDQRDEFILQDCTSKQDTTCFKVKQKSTAAEESLTKATCSGDDCLVQRDNSYLYTAPLYCAVLGAIILGLLIYVILRCRVNKKRAAHMAAHGGGHPSYQIVQPQQQQAPYYNTGVAHPPTSTSPIIYLDSNGKTVMVTPSTQYKDVPSKVRRTVAWNLAQDGSWLKLAHHLGFTPSEISQIQQKAEQTNRRSSVASILLSEWTKGNFSSVGVMAHALAAIDRFDLVTLVHTSNSMKGSEIV